MRADHHEGGGSGGSGCLPQDPGTGPCRPRSGKATGLSLPCRGGRLQPDRPGRGDQGHGHCAERGLLPGDNRRMHHYRRGGGEAFCRGKHGADSKSFRFRICLRHPRDGGGRGGHERRGLRRTDRGLPAVGRPLAEGEGKRQDWSWGTEQGIGEGSSSFPRALP